jgi:hypothetical protein
MVSPAGDGLCTLLTLANFCCQLFFEGTVIGKEGEASLEREEQEEWLELERDRRGQSPHFLELSKQIESIVINLPHNPSKYAQNTPLKAKISPRPYIYPSLGVETRNSPEIVGRVRRASQIQE